MTGTTKLSGITYDEVLQFIFDRIENAEDVDDWDTEADSYCNMLYDDLLALKNGHQE